MDGSLTGSGTLATIAPVPLRAYTGSTRVPWPTAMSGAHMNDTYLTAEGCRHFAAALAQERLGADEALASTVALAYSPIHKRPRPRGDLY